MASLFSAFSYSKWNEGGGRAERVTYKSFIFNIKRIIPESGENGNPHALTPVESSQ
jgi:hypothetical protein